MNEDSENVRNVTIDPVEHEANAVEQGFEDIQKAMRLGIISGYTVSTSFTPQKLAIRTYTFHVFDEHFTKLIQAENDGLQGRTDPLV